MSRINTNINSIRGIHDLRTANTDLSTSLERLSSGLRINSAADDPAGLIISELLRSDIASISQAVDNSNRALNVIQTAEGALNEVSSLLVTIRDLTVEAASEGSLTAEEIEANQLQIDSAVQSIERIAKSTNFGGTALLDGSLDYVLSGVDSTEITDLTVQATQFGQASSRAVNLDVTDSATLATLQFANSATGAAAVSLQVAGNKGVETLSFAGSTAVSAVSFAVNEISELTGVSSYVSTNDTLYFTSAEYGSEQFISIKTLEGLFTINGSQNNRVTGTDAEGTINGQSFVASGNEITLNTALLDLKMTVADGFGGTSSFAITGGGALFQLGGDVNLNQQQNIGIQSVTPQELGDGNVGYLTDIVTGGDNSLISGNMAEASDIIDAAILEISTLRGRLGSFQLNTLETNINSLEVSLENLQAAESTIRDADFAVETASLTRAQILVQAGTSVLATANATPQSVLNLLG